MGSDSLGTVTRSLVDPQDLAEYFDTSNGLKIRTGSDGRPLLDELSKILGRSQHIPFKHYTNVDKLFSLSPLEMGVMSAGIAAIGDRSIKNLVAEFRATDKLFYEPPPNYTLKDVGERLLSFLWNYYSQQYPHEPSRPELEFMLCGYDKQRYTPGVVRIYVHENRVKETDYDFCIFFGGQTREIQRVVFGIDAYGKMRLIDRTDSLLKKYHSLLTQQLEVAGIHAKLKEPEEFGDELNLFNNWGLEGLVANCGSFSEQTAIECMDFLVNIMIKSQRFSMQIPSVGGEVQIAIIKKYSGFTYISRREWRHGDYTVPMRE